MPIVLICIAVLFHLILPPLFLYWVAFNKGNSLAYRISVAALVGSFLVTMWLGGAAWHWFGKAWPIVFLVLFVPALAQLIVRSRNMSWLPEKRFWPWFGFLTISLLALVHVIGIPDFIAGRHFSGESIQLEFPLKNGTYHILHGGNSEAVNYHFPIEAQKYALDIVKVNKWGVRARGLIPKDSSKYEIFGEDVIAPCSGEVIATQNDLPDNIPPAMDAENLLGNHVILFCDGNSVLLAHLMKGTVTVSVRDNIKAGTALGKVGNSGNTSEPHLHLHIVKGRHTETKEIAGTASGIAMTFNGRFLKRNDRISH